jgi:hypothetical protein
VRPKTEPKPSVARGPLPPAGKPLARETSGDALAESNHVAPAGTLRAGQTATLTARNGRKMTCTGGNTARNIPRTCFWN